MLRSGLFAALFAAVVMLAQSASAQIVSFEFLQGGYDEGAYLSGSFSGEDQNSDGRLTWGISPDPNELSAFTLSFSGNSIVDTFTVGLPELGGFIYGIDGGPLGDLLPVGNEGFFGFALGPTMALFATGSAGFDCTPGNLCGEITDLQNQLAVTRTNELVQITTAVPEPEGMAIVTMGLALVAVQFRQRRREA